MGSIKKGPFFFYHKLGQHLKFPNGARVGYIAAFGQERYYFHLNYLKTK